MPDIEYEPTFISQETHDAITQWIEMAAEVAAMLDDNPENASTHLASLEEFMRTFLHSARVNSGPQEPVPSHPEMYPHGRCPVCGGGVNWAAQCMNTDCQEYIPGAEDEE